ncbi:MAG: nucleotide exchange factor GrpE [Nitrospinota bacterium]|nr:nucleotide exchange factor GrpE [Nitrospinota bacterium]MDH5755230.1 nucleotide exchange factor GrpE [Nitrospinota bacterium]
MEKEKDKEQTIEIMDRRRIKSAEDTCDDAPEADLDRAPTAFEKIKEEALEKDQKLKEYIAAYKEQVEEMEKARKRLEEQADTRASAKFADVVSELFPAMDDLDRALESARDKSPDDQLVKGVEMVRKRLFAVLASHGMEMINCIDEKFDPNVAQAVAITPVDDEALDDVVVEQLSPGYRMGGRVLRHAMVKVGHKEDQG